MSTDNQHKEQLPPPGRPGKLSRGAVIFAVIVLALTGAGLWWATRDETTRQELTSEAGARLLKAQNAAVGTVMGLLTAEPESPGVRGQASPATKEASTSALGTVHIPEQKTAEGMQPVDIQLMETLKPGDPRPESLTLPDKNEDHVVRPAAVVESARWLASRYTPAARKGVMDFNWQMANVRYANRANAFNLPEMDEFHGRLALLDYVFRPVMIQTLYNKYGEMFADALDEALRDRAGQPLTPGQISEAFRLFSASFSSLASGLDSVARFPGAASVLEKMDDMAARVTSLNADLAEAVFQVDSARARQDSPAVAQARQRVDALTDEYRRTVTSRDALRAGLLQDLRSRGARGLDDDTLFFLARWVQRRTKNGSDALAAASSASKALEGMAAKFQQRQ